MELAIGALGDGLAYADPLYAASLGEFGEPVELPRSQGWVLRRAVPGSPSSDAMGCYPLFSCRDWSQLAHDLDHLPHGLVSLTLVTDPFGAPPGDELRDIFDEVIPYKHHFLIDLDRPAETVVARHHRKAARKALRSLTIEVYDPSTELDTWCALYTRLVEKHRAEGIRAFSPASFAIQARIDGLVGLKATLAGQVIGMHWYFTAGDVAYAHLVALHPDAYALHADAGMIWTAMELFAGRFRWIDMGAGAGHGANASDGLTQFKAAWSSDTAPTFVCGKILDPQRYRELAGTHDPQAPSYFPAYRRGEFSPGLAPALPPEEVS